ncbi:MAG: pilus assembly protein [Thermoflexus hugenholtzii]|jgi:Flp pilus assembly protein TadG|uniref:TadE/TadG family type IV pilus assembly protein n=1 Tax=Thermoflexus TaxID=1495649 RepID=UPI001C7840F6|nr:MULTISPECIES: TadE/TadG family type IV pilus assembly protein [Thermoflexus]QWK11668.1 MAG: pilus assembly protein [Thermoflexus hugenholtzii]
MRRGQGLVELALSLTVLLLLVMGLIDLGRAFVAWLAIHDAAAEGALYAAVNPYCRNPNDSLPPDADPDVQCTDPNNVQYRAYTRALSETRWIPFSLVDPSRIAVVVEPNQGSSATPVIYEGDPITVTVIYTMPLITPLMQGMLGPELIIRAQAVQIALEAKPRNP